MATTLPTDAVNADNAIVISSSNNNINSNSEICSSNSNCSEAPKISKFFSSSINYQSKIQQVISFSFTSSNFIFITCILSISKLCTAAATDPAQASAPTSAPTLSAAASFLMPNISGSALLEKFHAFRATTLGPPLSTDTKSTKSIGAAAANSIGNTVAGSFFGGKGFMNMDFKYLNVSGKIGTSLGIAQNQEKQCEEKQFRCQSGECISVRFLCDGSPDCPDHSDESIQECKFRGK